MSKANSNYPLSIPPRAHRVLACQKTSTIEHFANDLY